MMTKKDYIKASKMVKDLHTNAANEPFGAAAIVEKAFVEFFRGDNPRFDVVRFKEACGR